MEKPNALIFGGSGYIGSYLVKGILERDQFSKILICDIKPPLYPFQDNRVSYIYVDVRFRIEIDDFDCNSSSWIFNLAAIHREPGHDYHEYFDTNIPGAENVCDFARRSGIKNMFFTSSIAPYGKSLDERTESSPLYPETAYGISKALAERIHREWLAEDASRRLIIVRPSVIFGPKDPGNVFRMIKALRKGTFILPDGGKVIKAYGYVFGLVESMIFTMQKKEEQLIIYNYAEHPLIPLNEMVKEVKKEFGYSRPTLKLPVNLLVVLAKFIQVGNKLIGKKSDIHAVRVKKAGFPTNIKPKYLIDNGFHFKYQFRNALQHWRSNSPEDFR